MGRDMNDESYSRTLGEINGIDGAPCSQPQEVQQMPMNGVTSDSDDMTTTILPTLTDVLECQFSSWYPIFSNLSQKYKGRKNVTIKSHVIKPLPNNFIEYLLSTTDQRFILPHNARTSSALLEVNNNRDDNDAWSSSDDNSDSKDGQDLSEEVDKVVSSSHNYSFPELNDEIHNAIQSFSNRACIPKLNWSSPKDATWINGSMNNMECRTAGDVYLLLKASDFIMYDLQYALIDIVDATSSSSHPTTTSANPTEKLSQSTIATTTDEDTPRHDTGRNHSSIDSNTTKPRSEIPFFQYELVLRKYCNLYPSQEFRCFISFNTIVGISQRYQQYYFSFLQDVYRNEYIHLIYDFYTNVIQPNIEMKTKLQQYVVDLYIDQQQRIWIIDFNVWGTRTDALLFHWSELVLFANQARLPVDEQQQQNIDENVDEIVRKVDFRIVESSLSNNATNEQQQPIIPNPLSNYKAPMDALFLGNNHGDAVTTATTFQDFMKLCVRPSTIQTTNDSSSSDSDIEG